MKSIRTVLVETSHPGNIGAAARAMATMGLSELVLVNPAAFPHPDATARAAGADAVLDSARVCGSLDEALDGCDWVLGVSARRRTIHWPTLTPREAAMRIATADEGGHVALVFGRERTGLDNDELDRCHALVTIPANPDYSSLNLAAAVQVVAYELRVADWEPDPEQERDDDTRLATAGEMEALYTHLEHVLLATGFMDPAKPRYLMRRLRRMFNRARPDLNELNILRGFLSSIESPTGPRHKP